MTDCRVPRVYNARIPVVLRECKECLTVKCQESYYPVVPAFVKLSTEFCMPRVSNAGVPVVLRECLTVECQEYLNMECQGCLTVESQKHMTVESQEHVTV